MLAVSPSLPANSVSQLVAYAKANPGKLTYGSAGTGSANHLAGEMFKHVAGIDIVHVPYKGNGPAIIDLLGGQIGMMLGSISSLYPHAGPKKLRLLAVASAKRSAAAPEIPTFTESGMPGYQVSGWNCIVAPRGTPATHHQASQRRDRRRLQSARRPRAAEEAEHRSRCRHAEQLAAFIKSEFARYSKLIKAVGLKVE